MSASWRDGCPVPFDDLRLLTLTHWGFDGAVRTGELVVHADWAEALAGVFRRLFEVGFPIERMELVDVYGADDEASMAANNSSAFNCRPVTGGSEWSEHAYGWAIDLNPVQNPYVTRRGTVLPPAGSDFLDRRNLRMGMVTDEVVAAFAAIGWGWGGAWSNPVDYQHFSASGR
jgi:poly-gamma-glutamate synthesis protein (capsule biosynthesis protein)